MLFRAVRQTLTGQLERHDAAPFDAEASVLPSQRRAGPPRICTGAVTCRHNRQVLSLFRNSRDGERGPRFTLKMLDLGSRSPTTELCSAECACSNRREMRWITR
jgi:hypothetical protein